MRSSYSELKQISYSIDLAKIINLICHDNQKGGENLKIRYSESWVEAYLE